MDRHTGKFIPKIKLSENTEKVTNPGNKTIQRIYDKETGKIIADLICLVDEEFDEKNSLLLFDPIETWQKDTPRAGHLHHARTSRSNLQKRQMRLRVSKGYGHPRILQERTGDAVG